MTYEQALDFLYSMLPMYQSKGKVAYKKDLSNTFKLLDHIENPQHSIKFVHIAGTNGKGSTSHMISAILQSAGYRTGLYTSPHLKKFTERIRIDGIEVDEGFVSEFVEMMKDSIESIKPSFFEVTVVMALQYFYVQNVDIAIIETGLGGRLDSTNVIEPMISVITNISYDHMDILGDTLPKIASEKAGIIKPKTTVVIGEYQEEVFDVFVNKSKKEHSRLIYRDYSNLIKDDWSYYKRKNASATISTIHELIHQGLNIGANSIIDGIENAEFLTGIKGRFQFLSKNPKIIADVSHNLKGIDLLLSEIKKIEKSRLIVIYGAVDDKDVSSILKLFPEKCEFIWSESNVQRSMSANKLKEIALDQGIKGVVINNVNKAIEYAKNFAKPDDLIVVTGSTFLVAEIANL